MPVGQGVDVKVGVGVGVLVAVGFDVAVGKAVAAAVAVAVAVAVAAAGVAVATGRATATLVVQAEGCTANAAVLLATLSAGDGPSPRSTPCNKKTAATSKTATRENQIRGVGFIARICHFSYGHGGIWSTCPGLTTGISQLIPLIRATFSAYVFSSGSTSTLSDGHLPAQ